MDEIEKEKTKKKPTGYSFIMRIVFPVLILAAGIVVSCILIDTAPEARRMPRKRPPVPVEVKQIFPEEEKVIIRATGTVIPAKEVLLYPRVGGRVKEVGDEFISGGFFQKGEFMVGIDPKDYELSLIQRKSEVARAEQELKVEMGHQDIAKKEKKLFKNNFSQDLDSDLALRVPHLQKAKAALEAAKASLEEAKLNLARTRIKAPFNCVVLDTFVKEGSQVFLQNKLATIAGTDAFHVMAALPAEKLDYLIRPVRGKGGSRVMVIQGQGENAPTWEGELIRILPSLEQEARMARVLISIKDPLGLQQETKYKRPLLLGAFVRVKMEGIMLEEVFSVAPSSLRDGDTLWVVEDDNTLSIRKTSVVWRNPDHVLVKTGIEEGERLVTSELAAAVSGMKVSPGDRTNRVPAKNNKNIKGKDRI